ncbi:hypothetical protein DFS34DRAFT_607211 [Phlyctochytrium arcticum]|nr:hypothetical protein DFS34DRAFT_607211 [Phlyctochytrium arcticum]
MSPARDAALLAAIALGLKEMVILILDAGIQSSPWESRESFPSTAVRFEQADILRLLLERNIISDVWDEESAIRLAIRGSFPLMEPFVEYGAVKLRRAVEIAIELGKLEPIQTLTEMPQSAPDLTDLLCDAESSAAQGHLDLVKYFVQQIRHKDEKQVQVAALEIFKKASTVPILEFCMPLTQGLSDDDRNIALNEALVYGYTEVAGFLIHHGATYDRNKIRGYLRFTREEPHFLCLWKLLGGTSNFSILTNDDGHYGPSVYGAISRGFWNVLETCLCHPAFTIRKSHHNIMVAALRRAVKDEQEKLLWHMIENVPESRSILLTDIDFPIHRSPALIQITRRCRELLIPTRNSPALRWEMSTLSDVFFNLIVQARLRPMETVVTPIGLDPETHTAVLAALGRICLLTVRLMADGNQDASLKQDLRQEVVICAAHPGCDTIPAYFATTICTEALERNEPVLFSVVRDALTGPSYPNGGVFYAHDGLKRRWLGIAVEQGFHDVVRSLVPSSHAENVALYQCKGPSPKCSIRIGYKALWRSAVKRAINEGDYVILELLRQTQYSISGHDATELSVILLEPAFIANDHVFLRYCRKIGVPFSHRNFTGVLRPAIYHDISPDSCTCLEVGDDNASPKESEHATIESICVYLGISQTDLELDAMDFEEVEPENGGMLFSDPTFVSASSELTRMSCQSSPRIAANYTTLVFNREGHAMCGDCLHRKLQRAKRARWRDAGGANEERPDHLNTDNIRVACNTMQKNLNLQRIFPVTPSLQRVPRRDAELFLAEDDAYVYFDHKRRFAQPNLLGKLEQDDYDLDNDIYESDCSNAE